MTLGFDNLINFWNLENGVQGHLVYQMVLPSKTCVSSIDLPYLVIASIDNTIGIISLNNFPNIYIPNQYTNPNL